MIYTISNDVVRIYVHNQTFWAGLISSKLHSFEFFFTKAWFAQSDITIRSRESKRHSVSVDISAVWTTEHNNVIRAKWYKNNDKRKNTDHLSRSYVHVLMSLCPYWELGHTSNWFSPARVSKNTSWVAFDPWVFHHFNSHTLSFPWILCRFLLPVWSAIVYIL